MSQSGLVALIIPGFLVGFTLLWSTIVFAAAHISGWASLARSYPGSEPANGQVWRFTSATLGRLSSYRNVLTVMISPEGLFIRPILPFRIGHQPLLIPWHAIVETQRTNLFLTEALRLEIRNPRRGNTQRVTFYGRALVGALVEQIRT